MASCPTRQLLSLNWAIRGLFLIPDSFLFCNSWWWRVRVRWGATDTISDLYWTSLRMNFGWPFFPIFFLLYIYKKNGVAASQMFERSVFPFYLPICLRVFCNSSSMLRRVYFRCWLYIFFFKKVWPLVNSKGFLRMSFFKTHRYTSLSLCFLSKWG